MWAVNWDSWNGLNLVVLVWKIIGIIFPLICWVSFLAVGEDEFCCCQREKKVVGEKVKEKNQKSTKKMI